MLLIKEKENQSKALTLNDSFRRYFSIELANTTELKHKVFNLRYRVYCEEFGYEPVESFPDEMETDVFDERSLHCLISHKSTGMAASCVRLVATEGEGPKYSLPFERICDDHLDQEAITKLCLNRQTVCEISRLAVDGAFRRRAKEAQSRFGEIESLNCAADERRTFPMLSVAAFLAATALTDLSGRTNVFAMMEPFLPRLMERSGICFQKVGRDVDFHGVRAPYFIRTQSALDHMNVELKDLYNTIYSDLSKVYRP